MPALVEKLYFIFFIYGSEHQKSRLEYDAIEGSARTEKIVSCQEILEGKIEMVSKLRESLQSSPSKFEICQLKKWLLMLSHVLDDTKRMSFLKPII